MNATGHYFPIQSDSEAIKFGGPDDKAPIDYRLDENLRVQRYLREHNGKMPPEDTFLSP